MIEAEALRGKRSPVSSSPWGSRGEESGGSRGSTPRCLTARGQGHFFLFLIVGGGLGAGLHLGVRQPQG